jgi:ABC-type arginine transport system permease subunit
MSKLTGYWIFTILMALWLTPSGLADVFGYPLALKILAHLGYPAYVSYILGVAKLLAMAAIFYPRTRLLREWAYAGLTFELIGAFISHVSSHDPVTTAMAPVLVLGFVAGSYALRPEKYRLSVAA